MTISIVVSVCMYLYMFVCVLTFCKCFSSLAFIFILGARNLKWVPLDFLDDYALVGEGT